MTQEEKQLLLSDLCARLPYGVMVHLEFQPGHGYQIGKLEIRNFWDIVRHFENEIIATIKPYLRPMSSMTEEEFESLKKYTGLEYEQLELKDWENNHRTLEFYLNEVPHYVVILVFDWLNAHHFDYRGLIEKGLALEAPKEMYE